VNGQLGLGASTERRGRRARPGASLDDVIVELPMSTCRSFLGAAPVRRPRAPQVERLHQMMGEARAASTT